MRNINLSILCLLAVGLSQAILGSQGQPSGADARLSPGSKGFTIVQTKKYTIEVPDGWTVGAETPWGARDIAPKSGPGQMGAMTAGPTKAKWDELYKTSLFFIKREEPGTESPFRTGKTKLGYDYMAFEVKNKDGFLNRRYTLIRSAAGNVLALSIRIPSQEKEKSFAEMFKHMVDTAKLK